MATQFCYNLFHNWLQVDNLCLKFHKIMSFILIDYNENFTIHESHKNLLSLVNTPGIVLVPYHTHKYSTI